MNVRDIMTTNVVSLERNDPVEKADLLRKERRVRHFPVLDAEGRLVGVLSHRDFFRSALAAALGYGERGYQGVVKTLPVKELMTENVVTVGPDATVADAARLMAEKKIGCLPVVDGDLLVGIVTESDLLRLLIA